MTALAAGANRRRAWRRKACSSRTTRSRNSPSSISPCYVPVVERAEVVEEAQPVATVAIELTAELSDALFAVYQALASIGGQGPQRMTRFHSKVPPAVRIQDYARRLQQYFKCSDACHVVALIYIDRLVKMHPEMAVSPLSIHRMLATATLVSAKFLDDVYYSNSFYAKVCGLRPCEMNVLEATFLSLLRWRLFVSEEEFAAYLSQLTKVQPPS
eukprot:TRINITY_DN20854_c0_g1_i1.p1 TRINITY_DN20854_c0_g1~~TRINITY_DN20854_c0_g1_i1.p1  ORF type:complete len:214 (+),score=42.25 TRINITY_DN20854_c0_g1_i1:71-712(+)